MTNENSRIEPMLHRHPYLCWGLLLVSGIVYGSSFSGIKVAVSDGASTLGLVFWFVLIASLLLGCKQLVLGSRKISVIESLGFCIPWAILSVILPNLLFFYAAERIQAGIIAIGISLVPIMTLAGAVLLGRESLNLRRTAGLLLGAAGLGMILLPDTSLPDAGDTLFVAIAFAGAFCYAVEHLFIEARIPRNMGLDSLLLLMFGSAVAILLPIVWITDSFILPNWPLRSSELAVLFVAVITLLDYFIITLLIVWAGPVFTSQAAYVVTLAGMIWGMVVFDDQYSGWIWGAVLVLAVGLSLVRPRERPLPEASR